MDPLLPVLVPYELYHCLRFDVNGILTPTATTPGLRTCFPGVFPVDLRFFKAGNQVMTPFSLELLSPDVVDHSRRDEDMFRMQMRPPQSFPGNDVNFVPHLPTPHLSDWT